MDRPNFIWGITDDVLRDLYARGKYRDVILPMTVLRRLDAVLEPSTLAVLAMKTSLDKAKIIHQWTIIGSAIGLAVILFPGQRALSRDMQDVRERLARLEGLLDGVLRHDPKALKPSRQLPPLPTHPSRVST